MKKRRVFLVDDHPLVRERLAQLIEREADLEVCGEAEDVAPAMEALKAAVPDILILDISLRTSHGLELLRQAKEAWPNLPVLVLSMHDESLYAERMLRAGAMGYITKQEATRKVLDAIRQVLKGEVYLSEKMSSRLLNKFVAGVSAPQGSPLEILTDRELEVFQMIGRGLSTRKIAEELHLGIKTVESYRARIKGKLSLDDATQLMQYALQWSSHLDQA